VERVNVKDLVKNVPNLCKSAVGTSYPSR